MIMIVNLKGKILTLFYFLYTYKFIYYSILILNFIYKMFINFSFLDIHKKKIHLENS